MLNFKKIIGIALLVLVFAATALTLVGCGGAPDPVDADSITYDGSKVEWEKADGAKKYKVVINGTTLPASTNSITYVVDADSVTIDITAIGYEDEESDVASKTFTRLPKIEELIFSDDGVMSWNAVPGATSYIVEVNGKTQETSDTSFDKFEIGKSNKIKVKPKTATNDTFSSFSDAVTKFYLKAPDGIKYENNQISWNRVTNAKEYEVYVSGILVDTVAQPAYEYAALGESFGVVVKAIGDGNTSINSKESEEQSFIYLDQITEFIVDDGTLKWDAVADAAGYDVIINSANVKKISTNEFADLPAGVLNRVKVKPYGTDAKNVTYFSDWSPEQEITILHSPATSWDSTLALDGDTANSLIWRAVNGEVSGYEVKLTFPDGNIQTYPCGPDIYFFGHDYSETGTYTVSVRALAAANSNAYDSAYSTPITVKRLATPNRPVDKFIVSDKANVNNGFQVYFSMQSDAKGFQLYKEDAKVGGTSSYQVAGALAYITVKDVIDPNVTTIQEITYKIQAIGGGASTVNGKTVVTLNSLSKEALEAKVTVLPVPTGVAINGAIMSWDGVVNASSYQVIGTGNVVAYNTEFNLASNITTAGDYKVQVCAMGNGAEILASPYSAAMNITKLKAPIDLRIGTSGESEGKLMWTGAPQAKSFSANISGRSEPINANTVDNINQYITTDSVVVTMVAVADYYDETAGVYYITSNVSDPLSLTKLATPTFPTMYYTETNILWKAPSNVSNTYTPTYIVYDGNGDAYNGRFNGTELDVSYLAAGTYTFKVKAIGDGVKFINSDVSEPVSVTKLESPEIKVAEDLLSYTWNGVLNAQRYVIKVNGKIVHTVNHDGLIDYNYVPTVFEDPSDYVVTVTAVSDGAMDSNPDEITTTVKRLANPDITFGYSDVCFVTGGKIIVKANETAIPNATGFIYYVGSTASNRIDPGVEYEYDVLTHGKFEISAIATGGKFDANGIFYVNSLSNAPKTITLLSTPAESGITVTKDGYMYWVPVMDANGYELTLVYEGEDGEEVKEVINVGSGASHTIKDYSTKKPIRYEIRTKGNGVTTIDSEVLVWYKK